MAAEALYNINFLLVNTVENIANSFDLPVSINGLTKKMDQTKKEELKKVLLKIVGNHGNVLNHSITGWYVIIHNVNNYSRYNCRII